MNIGIGITTHNRRDLFYKSWYHWTKFAPYAKIVVVDDGSTEPLLSADYRFEKARGIATAKNKCLYLLKDCDHIFLADDDIYPVKEGWQKPFVNSGEHHLQLNFEKNSKGQRLSHSVYEKGTEGDMTIFNNPNGVLYYMTKECVETVGGYDVPAGIWGFEHVVYSHRIHNLGITPYPFMTPTGAMDYFHVSDYYGEVESSVPTQERIKSIELNTPFYKKGQLTSHFVPLNNEL